MPNKRKKILMAVYNPIEVDGRVKRIASSLADHYDLTLLCPSASGDGVYHNSAFTVSRIAMRPRFGRVGRLLIFWWEFVLRVFRSRPNIVYAHDFFLPFPGWVAAKLTGAKLVYDAHELSVPESGERHSLRVHLFYLLERFVLPHADLVIAANPERAQIMQGHYSLAIWPTVVRNIPPLPQSKLNDSQVVVRYPLLKRENLKDVHLIYMGDINRARGLDKLLHAADLLPPYFKVIFVGGGPDLGYLKSLVASNATNRFRIVGPVIHDHVYDVLRQADIGFASYSTKGLNNIYCAPNKLFEYAQAGLPVVATCQPTIACLLRSYRIGELVGCNGEITSNELAAAFVRIASQIDVYRHNLNRFVQSITWQDESEHLLCAVSNCMI